MAEGWVLVNKEGRITLLGGLDIGRLGKEGCDSNYSTSNSRELYRFCCLLLLFMDTCYPFLYTVRLQYLSTCLFHVMPGQTPRGLARQRISSSRSRESVPEICLSFLPLRTGL